MNKKQSKMNLTHMICHTKIKVLIVNVLLVTLIEVRNSRITKSNYEIELRKMISHFELLTIKFLQNSSFELLTRLRKTLSFRFELPTQRVNFYISTFKLLTRC